MVYRPNRISGPHYVSCTNESLKPFFYINGKLHRHLSLNRALDQLYAYCYEDRKKYLLNWVETKRKHQKAFTIAQAARLIGRSQSRLIHDIADGNIPQGTKTHNINTGKSAKSSSRCYSEDELEAAHYYYASLNRNNKPAALVTNNTVTPWSEIQQRIGRAADIIYKKNKDGEYIPVWKEAK